MTKENPKAAPLGKLVNKIKNRLLLLMKNLSRNITFFVVICKLISCYNSEVGRIEKELIKSNNDSLTIILPDIYITDAYLKEVKEKRSRTLGLNAIERGSSETELRIWEDVKTFAGQVFIIKNKNKVWTAEMYNYKYEVSVGSFPDSLSGERKKLGEPTSGWTKFLGKLLDSEILTLPNHEDLSNYYVPTDERFVRVEISKRNYYRLYEYPNPYRHQGISSARKMVQILELVKKEFLTN